MICSEDQVYGGAKGFPHNLCTYEISGLKKIQMKILEISSGSGERAAQVLTSLLIKDF